MAGETIPQNFLQELLRTSRLEEASWRLLQDFCRGVCTEAGVPFSGCQKPFQKRDGTWHPPLCLFEGSFGTTLAISVFQLSVEAIRQQDAANILRWNSARPA